jgi:hypothetical protein
MTVIHFSEPITARRKATKRPVISKNPRKFKPNVYARRADKVRRAFTLPVELSQNLRGSDEPFNIASPKIKIPKIPKRTPERNGISPGPGVLKDPRESWMDPMQIRMEMISRKRLL